MNVLIVGAGVIGTVYGAQLGSVGHGISVLAHGDRCITRAEYHRIFERLAEKGEVELAQIAVVIRWA